LEAAMSLIIPFAIPLAIVALIMVISILESK